MLNRLSEQKKKSIASSIFFFIKKEYKLISQLDKRRKASTNSQL